MLLAAPIRRPRTAAGNPAAGITLIDATSSAGCTPFDASESDAYYFSPQKAFGADGGIWFALLSPAAIARAESIAASKRMSSFASAGGWSGEADGVRRFSLDRYLDERADWAEWRGILGGGRRASNR